MTAPSQVLHARAPSFVDAREDRCLLVWGELAQWMVVDRELRSFLELFDGKRGLAEIIQKHAKTQNVLPGQVQSSAIQVIGELKKRGILCERPDPVHVGRQSVEISNVTVNLTNRCNLQCCWCYNSDRATAEMPVQQMMDRIEQGRAVLGNDASFIILGGEPLIDPDRLMAALQRAETMFRPSTLVSTNGTLLTDHAVERLAPRRVTVQVSLDGSSAQLNDARRGQGSFERAVAGTRRLVHAGIPTLLSMVFDRESTSDLECYLDLALQLGANEARFIPMRMIGRGADYAAHAPDFCRVFEALLEILERRPELRPLLHRDFFSILFAVCRYSDFRTGCGIGLKVIFIDADGQVYPCPNHVAAEFVCGDLRRDHLARIVHHSPVMQLMRERCHVRNYEGCGQCPFRYWCAGDCRGEVLSVCGDPLKPSPHCVELRSVIIRMLWLIADGDTRLGMNRELPDGKRPVDSYAV